MSVLSWIAEHVWPLAGKKSVGSRLDEKLTETLQAADNAVASARTVAIENREDHERANEIVASVRGRVEQQSVRRARSVHDPKLSVIMDAVKIMENRR